MNAFLLQYLPILVFMGIAAVIGSAFLIAAFTLAPRDPDPEKISAYECGFNAFEDARMKFDVRFYLVSILFIVFDIEAAFLFPWAVSLLKLPHAPQVAAFWAMIPFIVELFIGFAYAWKTGALEWEGPPTRRRRPDPQA